MENNMGQPTVFSGGKGAYGGKGQSLLRFVEFNLSSFFRVV